MQKFISLKKSHAKGAAVTIVVFFFIAISLAIVQSATIGSISELRTYRSIATSKFAYVAAEVGAEDIFYRIISGKTVPSSQTIVFNNATSTTSVINISPTEIDIYATGNASNQIRKIYLKTTKTNGNVKFNYGAQIGSGGITMGNNVLIDGLGLASGDIYSDGPIEGAPGVTITGNAISAATIEADQTASSTLCTNDEIVGKVNPNIDFAQKFTIGTTTAQPLAKISLYIKRNGSPVGATIHIAADNAGVPSTTALASQVLDYTTVSTSYGWIDVLFTSPPTLNPATTYWIVLDATQHNSRYWEWCRSNSGTPGVRTVDWSSPTWAAIGGTLTFKAYLGQGGISQIEDVTVHGTAKADEIENANIAGDAYYQIISSSSVGGTSFPGSPTPPYIPLPFSTTTISAWKSDAALGGTITGNCGTGGVAACNTFPLTIGPKKITGNLLMDNNQTLTLSGTLHVQGNVDMSNNSLIKCAPAFAANSCMLIADGHIRVSNNMNFAGSGTAGSFIMLLTTKQGCLGGGTGSGCTTNNSALSIENNAAGALFYTTDSMIDISNNATVTAVIGYKLNLTNNAGINYDPLVSNLNFIPDSSSFVLPWSPAIWTEI